MGIGMGCRQLLALQDPNENLLLRPFFASPSAVAVLPPYSRQTAPAEVGNSIQIIDELEEAVFRSEEGIRKYPYVKLTPVQKQIYHARLLLPLPPH
jgi:hypothetical protein